MIRTTLAVLAVAMIPVVASAQSKQQPTWNDLLKPYEAKTNPAVPIAPPDDPVVIEARERALLIIACTDDAVRRTPLYLQTQSFREQVAKSCLELMTSN